MKAESLAPKSKPQSRGGRAPALHEEGRHGVKAKAELGETDRIAAMLHGVREAGLKLTPQRMAIVHTLANDPSHPTAQQIFDRLKESMPTMSFATVYNTLDALSAAGLCGSLSLSPGACRFDPNIDPHDHAVCDGCGLVRDVACEARAHAELPVSKESAHRVSGFSVRSVEHIYRGLCEDCAERAASNKKAPA